MFELARLFTDFILEHKVLWPIYFFVLWKYFIAPKLDEKTNKEEDERISKIDLPEYNGEDAVDHKLANDIVFNEDSYSDLIKRTQQKWLEGAIDSVKSDAREVAKSTESLTEFFELSKESIHFVFKRSLPDSDEYLISAQGTAMALSYVVSNKYFYFFTFASGIFAKRYEFAKVSYSAISNIDVIKGTFKSNLLIHLKEGKTLKVKQFFDPVAHKYVLLSASENGVK